MQALSEQQISQFISDGFVKLDHAFPSLLADECRSILWQANGCDPDNPASWTEPVVRIAERSDAPFQQAANTAILHAAFDQLVGKDNWLPRQSLGSFPIRFPSSKTANDTGWHVDASFPGSDPNDYVNWRINVYSKRRALLMLFLFSDVTEADAPTLIKIGSHGDVARLLAPAGEAGLSFMELAQQLAYIPERPITTATGSAGTVYLCHPFLVHAAQDHQGHQPKFMAQPPLHNKHPFNISPTENDPCPVATAIIRAIQSA
ncbi:MAG: phytanoyl-CoA dioxygenase family protein [Bacteroidota bacterium]|nr:phytanoyl-CoA dioxygenase family protein [Bacteroidota bacterium]